jgi:hypothetical protein
MGAVSTLPTHFTPQWMISSIVMGWLFAVALGMQEKSRRAAMAAILPIALGHALAIGVAAQRLVQHRLALGDCFDGERRLDSFHLIPIGKS